MATEDTGITIRVDELGKAADTLVKRIFNIAAVVTTPLGTVLKAKADAFAAVTKAEAAAKVGEIQQRAFERLATDQVRHQINIESIVAKALPKLESDSEPLGIDDDWIANFVARAGNISDELMQERWAKLLAGEANSPCTFSKRAVNVLADMGTRDAEFFQKLCSFGIGYRQDIPIIHNVREPIYVSNGITTEGLLHAQSLGLLFTQFGVMSELPYDVTPNDRLVYFGRSVETKYTLDDLDVGQVVLNPVGRELATISGASEVPDFFEYLLKIFQPLIG